MRNGRASVADLLQKGESSEFQNLSNFAVPPASNRLSHLRLIKVERRKYHCLECNGDRMFSVFRSDTTYDVAEQAPFSTLLLNCDDCRNFRRMFHLELKGLKASGPEYARQYDVEARVAYVHPPLIPLIPKALSNLMGKERDLFQKGRQAELKGFGIGAFAYYRRAMEEMKSRLLDQISEIAVRLGGMPGLVEEIEVIKQEPQFSKALPLIKHAMPQGLLFGGENPLKVLYKALSESLHSRSDEECLELAEIVRVVLCDLVVRLSDMNRSERDAKTALSLLAKFGDK